jgi:hypothetical protein
MKLCLFGVVALLTLINVSPAARALSSIPSVMARVPFSFSVGHDQLPPGTYTLTQDPWGLVTLESLDRRVNVIVTTTTEPCSMSGDNLIFRRYGDHHFLGAVSTSVLSAHFPVSKLEKSIQVRKMPRGQISVAVRQPA